MTNSQSKLFFRDDDLGWDHGAFCALLEIFSKYNFKLNAEAIPTISFEKYRRNEFSNYSKNLEVHTHGYNHLDHQVSGKKSEFGSERNLEAVSDCLEKAYALTENSFGDLFYPAFTPPWNRIDDRFLPLLEEKGFKVLSRDGEPRAEGVGLEEINISIDLHTQKNPEEITPEELSRRVIEKLNQHPSEGQRLLNGNSGHLGIMLHHQKMTEKDFVFFDAFLSQLQVNSVSSFFFSELGPSKSAGESDEAG